MVCCLVSMATGLFYFKHCRFVIGRILGESKMAALKCIRKVSSVMLQLQNLTLFCTFLKEKSKERFFTGL